jgi:hypothetical protein
MSLGKLGNLADLRAWWVVLRQALRMAPHPAAAPGAGESAMAAYWPRVLALILAGQFIGERVGRIVRDSMAEPLLRFRGWAASEGLAMPPGWQGAIDMALWRPAVPAGLTPVIPPSMLTKGVELAVLCGATLLVARLLRPRIPPRPAVTLALAALAAATIYDLLVGVLLFRMEDAFGIAAGLRTEIAADGRPLPGFEASLGRLAGLFGAFSVIALLVPLALGLCLGRGLRRLGHGRMAATGLAVLISLAMLLAGFAARRTGFGAALLRLVSF